MTQDKLAMAYLLSRFGLPKGWERKPATPTCEDWSAVYDGWDILDEHGVCIANVTEKLPRPSRA